MWLHSLWMDDGVSLLFEGAAVKDWGAGLRVGLSAAWGSTRRKKVARILNQIHSSLWVFSPLLDRCPTRNTMSCMGSHPGNQGRGKDAGVFMLLYLHLVAPSPLL